MTLCPYCEAENIEGTDECERCGQSLTELSIPVPATPIEADLMRDRIRALDPKTPTTVSPKTPVGDVMQQMIEEKIGCVMVTDGEKLVGIFSERDALMRLGTEAARLLGRPVSQFMTPSPVTLEAKHKIAFALQKMNVGGYRHLPIFSKNKLTGVISIRDILLYLTEQINKHPDCGIGNAK